MQNIEQYGYSVMPDGTIKNNKGYVLKYIKTNKGYYVVRPTICGVKKYFSVHRQVALKYIPNPNNLPQVGHKDHNKKNNSVDNLYWTNNSENQQHNRKSGKCVGANSRSKLTLKDVRYIRENYVPKKSGNNFCDLARKFNTTAGQIRRIYLRKRWLVD